MIYYTGIGSRVVPIDVVKDMEYLGSLFADIGFVLRSGGASGSDQAFERGCDKINGRKEIYIPWNHFNGYKSASHIMLPSNDSFELAKTIHPVFSRLNVATKKLVARNMHQVLGINLNSPSTFVVCWTSDGASSEQEYSIKTGGTGTAIVLADRIKIPVFNLKNKEHREMLFSY